jgi:hypothetical protein
MTRAQAAFAAAVGLGAGLMYYFDPERGSRRRTHARNQIVHASHRLRAGGGARGRLITPRTRRMATTLAGAAGLALTARAAMQARGHEFELRS